MTRPRVFPLVAIALCCLTWTGGTVLRAVAWPHRHTVTLVEHQ